jgi:hypothetical protein
MSQEVAAWNVRTVSLEDAIRSLRAYKSCPMIESLDKRIARQRELVGELLKGYGVTVEELLATDVEELESEELLLFYHLLRDADYIDSLR